jgi:predicted transcriptional regulator of viral defense system
MQFRSLLNAVGDEPLFETGLLLVGQVDPADVRRQLSRWTASGRLYQVRRGLYALAPPYQKSKPHPFVIANRLVRGSYVSRHAALAHYGVIPEYVAVTTSVTTGRPGLYLTPLGEYDFRHVKPDLFGGYRLEDVAARQRAFVATPEKALLDLVYLHSGGDAPDYIRELRLQRLERLNFQELCVCADRSGSPKLRRAAAVVADLACDERGAYEPL